MFVRRARELRPLIRGLKPRTPGVLVASDDYPALTFSWLFSEALQYYDGVLSLLDQPATSAAAFPVVRSLVEFAAQAIWIARGSGDASARRRKVRTRALCYEYGVAKAAVRNYKKLPTVAFAKHRKGAADRLSQISQMHNRTGCRCKGHSYRVGGTLKAMRRNGTWGFADSFYTLGSAFAHYFVPRWSLVGAGPDVRVGHTLETQHRILLAHTAATELAVGGRAMIAAEFPNADLAHLDAWRDQFRVLYESIMLG